MTIAAGIAVRETLMTEVGGFALWKRQGFEGVSDHESWKSALGDDRALERHVARGALVPIKVPSPGAFTFEIRVGSPEFPAELTPWERRYVADSSLPYRFDSLGGLNFSAIEAIGSEVGHDVTRVRTPPGEYAVTVHRMGGPPSEALPDFMILVAPG